MELREYIAIGIRWLWLVALAAILAGASAYFWSKAQQPVYRAESILIVDTGLAAGSDLQSLYTGQRLAKSYVERLTNQEVLVGAATNLGLALDPRTIRNNVSVAIIKDTELIRLQVTNTSPQIARDLANEIPAVFAERNLEQQLARFATSKGSLETELATIQVELQQAESLLEQAGDAEDANLTELNNNLLTLRDTHSRLLQSYEDLRIAEATSVNNLLIDQQAELPGSPISPNIVTNTMLAVVVGMLMAVGVAFVAEYFDDTIKSPEGIEAATGLSTLGTIRRLKAASPADMLVVASEPRSPTAEAYRQLRTNLQYSGVDSELKTVLITSANAAEGKSTTAANLATALAQSGKRVILVDADMRRPTLHTLFGVDGSRGLSNLIVSGRLDPSFVKSTLVPNLSLLPAGRLPPNPAEFLGSERMKELLGWLRGQAHYLIIDSPPLLAVTDGAVLSQICDTMILVASANQTRYGTLAAAVKQMQALDSHIAGIVVNKVNLGSLQSYYYYYYQQEYGSSDANGRRSLRERLQAFGISIFG